MRVLYFTDSWLPQVNGVSVTTALAIEGLRGRGWECHVVAPRSPVSGAPHDPSATLLPSVALPGATDVRITWPGVRRAMRDIERVKPDVVHCQTEFVVGSMGQRAAQQAGIPVVTSYFTDFTKYCRAHGFAALTGAVTRHLARFHQRAQQALAPSSTSCETLRRLGVPHVRQWGRAVDPRQFGPHFASRELRRTLGLGKAFTFLCVGRLAPEHGVATVLEAYRRVEARSAGGSLRLLIVGEGPLEESLRKSATATTLFLGERYHDLPAIFASAHAFTLASSAETLELVALQAMCSGLPVIATGEGGVDEYLRSGENGLEVPPGDTERLAIAMQRLVQDRDLHQRLVRGALQTASLFNWDTELTRLEACYDEVIELSRVHRSNRKGRERPSLTAPPTHRLPVSVSLP